MGRTGAGKSSVVLSLLRMIQRTSGTISIDGKDIASVALKRLRSAISVIPQVRLERCKRSFAVTSSFLLISLAIANFGLFLKFWRFRRFSLTSVSGKPSFSIEMGGKC